MSQTTCGVAAAAGMLLALLLAVASVASDAAPADRGPSQVVERLHASLLECMRNAESLGYQGRYRELAPTLEELFDLPFMAQKAVGRHWKTASPEDQHRLVDTFSRYTVSNYAGRFDGFSGQSFETIGAQPSTRGTVLVRTQLIDPEGDDVKLDYRLRETDGRWRIIDVYLNGTVSELALRRAEYSSLIKREGFEGLLLALDERIDEMAAAPADQAS